MLTWLSSLKNADTENKLHTSIHFNVLTNYLAIGILTLFWEVVKAHWGHDWHGEKQRKGYALHEFRQAKWFSSPPNDCHIISQDQYKLQKINIQDLFQHSCKLCNVFKICCKIAAKKWASDLVSYYSLLVWERIRPGMRQAWSRQEFGREWLSRDWGTNSWHEPGSPWPSSRGRVICWGEKKQA